MYIVEKLQLPITAAFIMSFFVILYIVYYVSY